MTSLLSIETLVSYGLLTASILGLWVSPLANPRLRPSFWNVSLLLAMGYGIGAGLLEPFALVSMVALGLSVYMVEQELLPISLRLFSAMVVIGLSLVLMLHLAPGFIPLRVIDAVQISHDALPYTKSLNFDKPLIGLLILAFGHRLLATPTEWGRMLKTAGPYVPVVLSAILLPSFALGYVRLDVKWPPFWWFWIWTNLVFTCVSEEALFRGFVQRYLERLFSRYSSGPRLALGVAALLFGMVHFPGGVKYVMLATLAGWGYGFVYQRTRRIEASILTHFLLNSVHFVFFSYPALASAVA